MLVEGGPECVVHLYGALYFFFDSHKWSSVSESWLAWLPANQTFKAIVSRGPNDASWVPHHQDDRDAQRVPSVAS